MLSDRAKYRAIGQLKWPDSLHDDDEIYSLDLPNGPQDRKTSAGGFMATGLIGGGG